MRQPPRSTDFLGYVGSRDIHDGRIVAIDQFERGLAVRIQTHEGRTWVIEFAGVAEVEVVQAEGMLLYALAEFRADPPLRRFEFAPWDEPDDETKMARLSVLAAGFTVRDALEGAAGDQIASYLRSLDGPDGENARHSLIEIGPAVIRDLEAAFKVAETDRARQAIVHVAWQVGSRESLPLLQDALEDAHDRVWKEALDGLVTIGGSEAIAIVRQAGKRTTADKRHWLDEAIQQMTENLS